ncbi:MAG: hypothetical protein LBF13_01440 [Campylobacteraceae bacterium]|jgi:hypothetical protein|nr:hypothetical protein [Campylobacteraceae bacterium]
MKYKFLSAILIVGFLVCGANAKSFGNSDVSIEKIFPPFNIKNADRISMVINLFKVTNEEFNAFVEQIEKKAAAEKNKEKGAVVFTDYRKNIKGVGKERLFFYNNFDMSKDGKEGTLVIAEGERNINGGLEIKAGVSLDRSDANESVIAEFLPPINAPRLNISIRKDFENANLTKECEEYIDTLKKQHSFDMPNDFKMLKDVYHTLDDAKRKQEMEHLLNSMAVKYAGDFKYTAVCKFEGGISIIDLNIERVKF